MKEYKTITQIAGPLIFVEKTDPVGYADIVKITLPNGEIKNGQVLDTSDDMVVVQFCFYCKYCFPVSVGEAVRVVCCFVGEVVNSEGAFFLVV